MTPATHRDQLVAMLAEAAEIEHCLMCTYLYAAFSLKERADEDLQPKELAAIRRWRSEIIRIATDEMLHLTLVNNLLIAIGARPHYRRFNFPVAPGLFPADVAVALAPFDAATLDHFIYLERPRSSPEHDATLISKARYRRVSLAGRLMDAVDDYETVGELYETIGLSFAGLSEVLGENGLLIGLRSDQLCEDDVPLASLCTVGSLEDVLAAIRLIIAQGEGSEEAGEQSHFARFRAIRDEWHALASERASFTPGRPAARNPVMRAPVAGGERLQILAEPALSMVDLGNAAYGLMLRMLALMSDPSQCAIPRSQVMQQCVALMHAITDIGCRLTELPANPSHPGVCAGLTFTVSRTALGYPSRASAATIIAERLEMVASSAARLAPELARLELYSTKWRQDSRLWMQAAAESPEAMEQPKVEMTVSKEPGASNATSAETSKVTVAIGKDVTIRFDTQRCIHARHCVTGEPEVFLADTPGEWIFPDRASPERLAIVAHNCPSGAIQIERRDGAPAEAAPPVNLVRLRENGPLAFHADIDLSGDRQGDRVGFRATLCRCGASKNKPFCDGSHIGVDFRASGEPPTRASKPLTVRNGRLLIQPQRNGPLAVVGSVEICAGTGRTIDRVGDTRLCRCGHSADKPFCDGSHGRVGFEASGA